MMALSDQQQFEIALQAVSQSLISSNELLAAIDRWRRPDSGLQSLHDALLASNKLPQFVREQIAGMYDAATDQQRPDHVRSYDRPTQHESAPPDRELNERDLDKIREILQAEASDLQSSRATAESQMAISPSLERTFSLSDPRGRAEGVQRSSVANASNDDAHRFRLIELVAVGGLGEVYKADDRQLNRMVAVKKIRSNQRKHPIAREKFTLEAEVTGQLEHPGIVPVYALGVDQNSEPYYSMRFITGENLADRIATFHRQWNESSEDFDGLALRQLLRRFLDVCNAMEYAHSRGVVHRDLKPANIMLGSHGETLVVDWGLAKVLSKEKSIGMSATADGSQSGMRLSGSSDLTVAGFFMGTVRYAPPEQLLGRIDQLDARSDVFSLGAILYEILTGRPPVVGDIRTPSAAYEFLRGGQAVPPAESKAAVPKPLSAVCMMALAFNRADRYVSARALGEDIERWLGDECVHAYHGNEPILEKAGRWLRKHRSWTLSITATLIVITLTGIAASILINRARTEEAAARVRAMVFKSDAVARYRTAKSAIDSLVERSESLQDYPHTQGIRQQLLEEAATIFDSLAKGESLDTELQLERVQAMVRLADVLGVQGNIQEAQEKYQQALELTGFSNENLVPHSSRPELLLLEIEVGRIWTRIGLAHQASGDEREAEKAFQQSIATLSGLEKLYPDSVEVAGNLAIALGNQGELELESGQRQSALKLFERALTCFDKAQSARRWMFDLPATQTRQLYASTLRSMGQHALAIKQFQMVQQKLDDWLRDDPKNWRYRESRASLLITWSNSNKVLGDFERALSSVRQARETYQQLVNERPDSLNYLIGLGLCQLDEGLIQLECGQADIALEGLKDAVELFGTLVSDYPSKPELQWHLANSEDALAQSAAAVEQQSGFADAFFQKSQGRLLGLASRSSDFEASLARFRCHHALHLWRQSNHAMAREQFDVALDSLEQLVGQDPQSIQWRTNLADACWHAGAFAYEQAQDADLDRAQTLFERSRQFRESLLTEDSTPLHQFHLARLYLTCPVESLRDRQRGRLLARLCAEAIPSNQAFTQLYAEVQAGRL